MLVPFNSFEIFLMTENKSPKKQGLYNPKNEHDSCGVGFVANIQGQKSHTIVKQGLEILTNLTHRGATGYDPNLGDGAGILIQMPDELFRADTKARGIKLPELGRYGGRHGFSSSSRESQAAV